MGRLIPGDRPLDALAERRVRLEAETLPSARRVQPAPRLPVGLRGVPDRLALVPRRLGDELGQVADRDLLAGPEIHGLAVVVALCREQQPFRTVLDEEELTGRRAVAPEHDLALAAVARLRHL